MSRKYLLIVGILLMSLLAACAGEPASDEGSDSDSGSLEGTQVVVALRSLPETDFIVERLPEFEEATGIDVEIVNFAEQQLREKTVQDLSTGAGQFDVIAVDSVFVPEFAEAGWIVPLDGLMTDEYDIEDLPASVRGLLSRDGNMYGVPVYAEITHLMYRQDLFDEAGLEPPTTMEELAETAQYFSENVEGVDGFAIRGLRGNGMNVYTWSQWLRSYGGEYLNENSEPIFNNEAAVEATENYASLLQNYGPEGAASFAWDDVQTAFATGQVAMIIDANNFYTRIADPEKSEVADKIGYANVPAGPAGQFPGNYTLGFGISAVGATTDAEQRAAAEFLMWATGAEMQEASIEAGIVSQTRTSVLTSDKFNESFPEAWLTSTIESWAMTDPNYRPLFTGWRAMGDRIGIAVQEVIAGDKDAQTALDEAAAEVTDNFEQLGLLGQPRPYPAMGEASMGAAAAGAAMSMLDSVDPALAGTDVVVALRSLPETDFIVERLPEFIDATGINVEIVNFAEQQLREKTVQDLTTGAGQFDVIGVDSVFVPEFGAGGYLVPLNDLFTDAYDSADLPEAVLGLLSWDGSMYGVPVYAEITHLMYRSDLFEEAGLEAPTTLDELTEVAQYFSENVEGVDGFAIRGLRGNGMNVYTWSQWLRSYGGEYLDEESTPIFNNEAGVKATEEYANLLINYGPEGAASFAWDDVQTAFATGQVAMIIDANNFYTRIENPDKSEVAGKIGYANVPSGPAGQYPANYTLGFGISAVGATTDAEQAAAAAFIMWATSKEMQTAAIDVGIVSQTRTSVLTSDKFNEAFPADWLSSTVESWAMTDPNYRPLFTGWRTMGDRIGIAVQEVIAGDKDAQTALDEAEAEVTDSFERLQLLGQPRPYDSPLK